MTPCKFQMDATGSACLIYSEDRSTIWVETDRPRFVEQISDALDLKPLTKRYAMAELTEDGEIIIGEALSEQEW